MKKAALSLLGAVILSGCATTGQVDTDVVVTSPPPRVVYVYPHHHWPHHRHYWHWGWHHRHGWGAHHPHIYHAPRHHHRGIDDQRRTIPVPINPGNGSHIPRNEHLK